MRKILPLLLALLMTVASNPVLGQTNSCDTDALSDAIANHAEAIADASVDEIQVISDDIADLISDFVDNCSDETVSESTDFEELFTVRANGNVNIRSCGDTTCEIVTTSTDGQVYSVVGEEDDWFEIELEDGETGYIASWLTTRGPDEVIDIYEGYADRDLMCGVQGTVSRSTSSDIDFAITGEGMSDVLVDIYRPNSSTPEPVWRQLDKTFIDTGETYIHQIYRSSYWPAGTYQLGIERNGVERTLAFDLSQSGETTIFVFCE